MQCCGLAMDHEADGRGRRHEAPWVIAPRHDPPTPPIAQRRRRDRRLRDLLWLVLKRGNGRALHMRVPLDPCCPVLLNEPPLTGIDGSTADGTYNRRRLLEPHRFLPPTAASFTLLEDTPAYMADAGSEAPLGDSAPT